MADENQELIYLDGFSTLPLASEARNAMLAAWKLPGNPSSPNFHGERGAETVANARREIADLIGAAAEEIYFTSGATEANNLAISGVARQAKATARKRRRVVVSAVEHKAVLGPARALTAEGFEAVIAPVGRSGVVDLDALEELVDDSTLLVSVMAANNETGVIQPIREVSSIAHGAGALMHCDAAQAVGKVPIDVVDLEVDYMSMSAHKMYGPIGVGALYMATGSLGPMPLLQGGDQEAGLRPGTEPVPLIAGFGAAAALAGGRQENDMHHGRRLAASMLSQLKNRQVDFFLTTEGENVLPGSLSIGFPGLDSGSIINVLAGKVSISAGSACTSGEILPSHVLTSMGLDPSESSSVLRIFCSRYTSMGDIVRSAELIADACLREAHRAGRSRQ